MSRFTPAELAEMDQAYQRLSADFDTFMHAADAAYRIAEGDHTRTAAVLTAAIFEVNEKHPERDKTLRLFLAVACTRLAAHHAAARNG